MKQKLNELKNDYNNRFQEITEGDIKLKLKLGINLKIEDINDLVFDNVNDVKTNLEALEKQYFDKLTSKCSELKTKYDKLVASKDKLGEEDGRKKQADDALSKITNGVFNIEKYKDYNDLNVKLCEIECLLNGDNTGLKKKLQSRYESYLTTINNLSIEIKDIDINDLRNKIDNFNTSGYTGISSTLDKISESIAAKIQEINSDLKKEYDEIIKKIGYFDNTKEQEGEKINPTSIAINITENTDKETYGKLVNYINNLRASLSDKLTELKNRYEKEINALNKKLKILGLNEINLNDDLTNLTFDNLTNGTILSIENAITEAENNRKTVEDYRRDCTNSLEQVKNEYNYSNISDTTDINNIEKLIGEIEKKIKEINNVVTKESVNESISGLKAIIKEASLKSINEIFNDGKSNIKRVELGDINTVDFIGLLKEKLNIIYGKDEKTICTINQKGTKIKELYRFYRNGKDYFIIFYEGDFKLDSITFNRKVVLVTSNNVITIGYYYYYSTLSTIDLYLKCNTTEKPFCKTEISYSNFIKCICATKKVNFDGLLMKFKAMDEKNYGKIDQDTDSNSFCFNLINKEVYYVKNKEKTGEKINKNFSTLDNFGTISQRTNLM